MPAQVKEVVMNRYLFHFQNIHPYFREDYLQRTLWGHIFIGDRLHFGFRQRRQFDFALN